MVEQSDFELCEGEIWFRVRQGTVDHRQPEDDDCSKDYRKSMGKRRSAGEAAAPAARVRQPETATPGYGAIEALFNPDRKALRRWYAEELQPRLSRMDPTEIVRGAAVQRSYAYYIVAGTRVRTRGSTRASPRSQALPRTFAATLSVSAVSGKSGRSAKGALASA